MADKSKMTVAEILAAARKADAPGGAPAGTPSASAPAESAQAEAAPEETASSTGVQQPAAPVAKKPTGGARPSVADMLAMARGEKQAAAAPATPKVKEKPAAAPAAAKSPAAKKEGSPAKAAPVDTQSILAAAQRRQSRDQ